MKKKSETKKTDRAAIWVLRGFRHLRMENTD
jgi:hypothetical protein